MLRRDRTDQFVGYRLRCRRGGFGGDEEAPAFSMAVAPAWMENVRDIEYDVQRIENKMAELASLHREHLLPQFSHNDFGDGAEAQVKEIDILTAEITEAYQSAYFKIKRVGEGDRLSSEEQAMRKNIQASLAVKLQELSFAFKQSQKDYLSKLRGMQAQEEDPFQLELDESDYHDPGFSQELLETSASALTDARAREEEMRTLLESLQDLNSIFKDIAILVIEQGTVLDRIDYNIENAEIHVVEAERELEKAHEMAKSSTSKRCMIILVLLVLLFLLLGILAFKVLFWG